MNKHYKVNKTIFSTGYNPEAPALSAASIAAVPPTVQAPSIDFSVPPPPFPSHVPPAVSWQQNTYTVPSVSTSVLVQPTNLSYDPTHPSTTITPLPVARVNFFTHFSHFKII